MSLLQSALRETLPRVPERLDELSALIDPAWIEQALAVSGKGSIRRRKLPAEHAVWLVIGLALFRDRPMWQVVQQLELSLEGQPRVSGNTAQAVGGLAGAVPPLRAASSSYRAALPKSRQEPRSQVPHEKKASQR